jgi:hypothetical protein
MMYTDTLKGTNPELAVSMAVGREASQAKRRFSGQELHTPRDGMIGSSQPAER